MGGSLARTIQSAGHDLVVWNRSPEKMQPFQEGGVTCASDFGDALVASPVILICVSNYTDALSLFNEDGVPRNLEGRTIVQLTSGSTRDAVNAAQFFHDRHALYLDGAILSEPDGIGTGAARILLSGDESANKIAFRLLECLGDDTVRYLGDNVKVASTLDMAWLMTVYGSFIAGVHAANICQSEGVDVGDLRSLLTNDPILAEYLKVVEQDSYDDVTAPLQVWSDALHHIQEQGAAANINTEIPDFFASFFSKAMAAGYGQKNVMSLLKILQADT